MIINKNSQLEAGSVYVFKMTNGEEIIAHVKEVGNSAITVRHPMTVFVTPDHHLGMQPAMVSIDHTKPVSLYRSSIAMSAPPSVDIASNYEKQTTQLAL